MGLAAVLILISVLVSPSAGPQQSDALIAKTDLYSAALFASLAEMQKAWGQIDDRKGSSMVLTDYRNIPVERNPEITDGLPSTQNDYRVDFLDTRRQIERFKNLKKKFSILSVSPIQVVGTRQKTTIRSRFLITRSGGPATRCRSGAMWI